MTKTIFSDESLIPLIKSLMAPKETEDALISRLSQMDLEERKDFLITLKDIYLLNVEEARDLENLRKMA